MAPKATPLRRARGTHGVLARGVGVLAALAAPLSVSEKLSPCRGAASTSGPRTSEGPLAEPPANGLALALEPAGGSVNFLAMVDNLQGDSGRGYYLEMLIGTPPQKFDVTVRYTQGSWTGSVGEDVVAIPKGLNSSFLVNVATIFESESFFLPGIKWNGILGLAYATLAKPSSSLETFFDSLVAQAGIPDLFSMQMCGAGLPVAGAGTNGGSLWLCWTERAQPPAPPGGGFRDVAGRTGAAAWSQEDSREEPETVVKPSPSPKRRQGEPSSNSQAAPLAAEASGGGGGAPGQSGPTSRQPVSRHTSSAGRGAPPWVVSAPAARTPRPVCGAGRPSAPHLASSRGEGIPEFSDGFWMGSQLACWTNSETPWSYFPKISIYLRDENASRSFRITILPQLYIQPVMVASLSYGCYRFGISPSANALVIGATVMEGFYVVFDRARKRVGFAASPCAGVSVSPGNLPRAAEWGALGTLPSNEPPGGRSVGTVPVTDAQRTVLAACGDGQASSPQNQSPPCHGRTLACGGQQPPEPVPSSPREDAGLRRPAAGQDRTRLAALGSCSWAPCLHAPSLVHKPSGSLSVCACSRVTARAFQRTGEDRSRPP
ncbi:PREDICTED: beta-secretase 2 [Condylura cristata]|uniref:beta-secretase 2 n=1 Tax=Condylura cristata TaxID=143302 RepID=UPI0006436E59|nr:PREDICTED: beta-secretase 2 [Condylura cristata]